MSTVKFTKNILCQRQRFYTKIELKRQEKREALFSYFRKKSFFAYMTTRAGGKSRQVILCQFRLRSDFGRFCGDGWILSEKVLRILARIIDAIDGIVILVIPISYGRQHQSGAAGVVPVIISFQHLYAERNHFLRAVLFGFLTNRFDQVIHYVLDK